MPPLVQASADVGALSCDREWEEPTLSHSDTATRLRTAVQEHYAFLWRSVRRFGVPEEAVDDALQQVFLIASRKLSRVHPSKDRSFLLGIAIRVASNLRRSQRRRREIPVGHPLPESMVASGPEEAIDEHRARQLLDAAVQQMSEKLRTVFVLFELEELSMAEISSLLGIPKGTTASRLRLARAEFDAFVRRMRAEMEGRAP